MNTIKLFDRVAGKQRERAASSQSRDFRTLVTEIADGTATVQRARYARTRQPDDSSPRSTAEYVSTKDFAYLPFGVVSVMWP